MFKKKPLAVMLGALALGLAACTPTEPPSSTSSASEETSSASSSTAASSSEETGVVVTFKVGDVTVHTENLGEDGGVPEYFDYEPEEGELVGWYLTPTFSRIYNFEDVLTESATLFGATSIYQADTRDYYLSGSGTSPLLSTNDWGKAPTDAHKLAKAADSNTYTLTTDFFANDSFQITSYTDMDTLTWDWQIGAGYIINMSDLSGIVEGGGGINASNRKSNINILKDGNYTLTLKTYPDHDAANLEEKINNLNNLTIVRNGDPVAERPEFTYDYYIKGENITAWKDMYNAATEFQDKGDGRYELKVYLRANEVFMFSSRQTALDGTVSTGSIYINWTSMAEDSKPLFIAPESGNNITAKDSGMYTFTYVPNEDPITGGTLSATVDTTAAMPVYDYYLNATILGSTVDDWSTSTVQNNGALLPTYKFGADPADEDIYVLKDIDFRVGDAFSIASFVAGSTETGEGWVNQKVSYNATYAAPETLAGDTPAWAAYAPADKNYNFKCLVAGSYDIAINVYSQMVTVTPTTLA